MSRWTTLLTVLALVSCKEKPKPPEITPAARGAAFFADAADRLGEVLAKDLKAENEKAFAQYLGETGAKNEAELGRKIGKEVLVNYAQAMALTEAQEAAFKSGKFPDAGNFKRVNAAIGRFADTKIVVPKVCQVTLAKVQTGEWKSGLQLEFAARLLEGHLAGARR